MIVVIPVVLKIQNPRRRQQQQFLKVPMREDNGFQKYVPPTFISGMLHGIDEAKARRLPL